MPAEIKTHPATRQASLQGAVFTFQSDKDRFEAVDQAFHYRGDVTLTVRDEQVEGYIFNRDPKATPPRIEVFVKGGDEPQIIPYADITAIAFDKLRMTAWEMPNSRSGALIKVEPAFHFTQPFAFLQIAFLLLVFSLGLALKIIAVMLIGVGNVLPEIV